MVKEAMLAEFDMEMENTRKALERIPDGAYGWRPHEKSWTLGDLVTHISNLPKWTVATMKQDEFDFAPEGDPQMVEEAVTSTDAALKMFDKNVKDAHDALASVDEEKYFANWSLKKAGEEMFKMPRVAVIRSFIMNHMIHHRGQLSVYMRMNDVPLPNIYGPTADEPNM